jgi:hypothetical protein
MSSKELLEISTVEWNVSTCEELVLFVNELMDKILRNSNLLSDESFFTSFFLALQKYYRSGRKNEVLAIVRSLLVDRHKNLDEKSRIRLLRFYEWFLNNDYNFFLAKEPNISALSKLIFLHETFSDFMQKYCEEETDFEKIFSIPQAIFLEMVNFVLNSEISNVRTIN